MGSRTKIFNKIAEYIRVREEDEVFFFFVDKSSYNGSMYFSFLVLKISFNISIVICNTATKNDLYSFISHGLQYPV